MASIIKYDPATWVQKARAFVTRSHRHLWGKNNEDPQAFLFQQGLKNSFIKEQVMGWNKFAQERPAKNWGAKTDPSSQAKLQLIAGIVIPYIVQKELRSVFIHPLTPDKDQKTLLLSGSLNATIILGCDKKRVVFVQNIFDGLFLFQEKIEALCVIIHPDIRQPLDKTAQSIIAKADQAVICSASESQKQTHHQMFARHPDNYFYDYASKEELVSLF